MCSAEGALRRIVVQRDRILRHILVQCNDEVRGFHACRRCVQLPFDHDPYNRRMQICAWGKETDLDT